jgi:hypothetical protein
MSGVRQPGNAARTGLETACRNRSTRRRLVPAVRSQHRAYCFFSGISTTFT